MPLLGVDLVGLQTGGEAAPRWPPATAASGAGLSDGKTSVAFRRRVRGRGAARSAPAATGPPGPDPASSSPPAVGRRRHHRAAHAAHRHRRAVGRQTSDGLPIGDAEGVLELLWLLITTLLASMRPRHDLVFENLLLRHQLAVLTRPTRSRRTARLRTWDKLLWVLARRFCAGWRQHLTIVTPDTVVRWHRQG